MKSLSRVQLFVTPWTVAYQVPLFIGFSGQEYWHGLPFPSPGDLCNPRIEPGSPTLQADALPSEPPGKSYINTKAHVKIVTLTGNISHGKYCYDHGSSGLEGFPESGSIEWSLELPKVKVVWPFLILCNPMNYTVHGILQAWILEWVAFPFSRRSSQLRDRTQVSHVAGGLLTSWSTREAQEYWSG